MLVKSGTVRRIITPNQALWIPAGTPHAIHFLSETAMRTLYFAKAPERMRVLRTLSITPLIRELTGTLFLKNLSTKKRPHDGTDSSACAGSTGHAG